MNSFTRLFLSASLLIFCTSARADTLTLKNGTVLNGTFLNSTGESLRFQTVTGSVETIAYSQVLSLATSPGSTAVLPTESAAYSPTITNVTLPAGTVLLVEMMDGVTSKSEPGTNFTTKLQYDLMANGGVAVRAGAIIYGQVQRVTPADRDDSRFTPDLRLTQMVANGIPVVLVTGSFTPHVEPEGKKTVAGGSTAPLKPGQSLTIPPGALLEFTLQQPVTVSMVR